jgi:hypothetical protein
MSTSPVPKKEKRKEQSFQEVLGEVLTGKKIARLAWPNGEYVFMKDGRLKIFRDGKEFDLIVTDGDFANDWVILEK